MTAICARELPEVAFSRTKEQVDTTLPSSPLAGKEIGHGTEDGTWKKRPTEGVTRGNGNGV